MTRFDDATHLLDPYHYQRDGLEGDYPTPSPWWEWYRDQMVCAYGEHGASRVGKEPPLPSGVQKR
jgi:hypothetical protein